MPARERGGRGARAEMPTRTLLEVGTEPWRQEGEYPPTRLHGSLVALPYLGPLKQGLGSCLPGLFPSLCAGLWGQRSWAPTPR